MCNSYPSSLPDSQSLVDARSDSLISLLPTLSSFLSSVVSLERDHAKALSALSGKARQHASKDAEQRASERGGRDATVEVGWQRVLEQTDVDARKREAYADRLEKEVVAPLAAAGQRFEGVRKKVRSSQRLFFAFDTLLTSMNLLPCPNSHSTAHLLANFLPNEIVHIQIATSLDNAIMMLAKHLSKRDRRRPEQKTTKQPTKLSARISTPWRTCSSPRINTSSTRTLPTSLSVDCTPGTCQPCMTIINF